MAVLLTCKNEKDLFKNEGESAIKIIHRFFRSRAANFQVSGGIRSKFELIQIFMVVLVTCKNEDPIKKEGTRVPLYVYGNFFRRSRAANSAVRGRIGPKFELIRNFMVVLLTRKNEEELIENEGARVLTRFSPL